MIIDQPPDLGITISAASCVAIFITYTSAASPVLPAFQIGQIQLRFWIQPYINFVPRQICSKIISYTCELTSLHMCLIIHNTCLQYTKKITN
jgi:hypothetical protein